MTKENSGPVLFSCTPAWVEAAAADGKPALPRFTMTAYTGGKMNVGGWRYPVVVDLAGMQIPSQSRPIRLQHDAAQGVGHTDAIRVEGGKLLASGIVSRDTPAAREVVASSRNGFPWQASIGAAAHEVQFIKEDQKLPVNGTEISGPFNLISKSTLGEISFVDLGADGQTDARVAAHKQEEQMKNTSEAAAATVETQPTQTPAAAPVAAATPIAAAAPTAAPAAASAPAVPVASQIAIDAQATVEDIRVQAAAETKRINAIRRICGGKFPEIEAKAIGEGWDETKCELEVLRASRPTAPAVHTNAQPALTSRILEAACALTAKLERIETDYDAPTLDFAHKRFRGGIGLQELLLEAAWAHGYTGRNFRDSREVLRFAFAQDVQAEYSTVDIGGILSNLANKFLLEGFFSVEQSWRNICSIRNVKDFKTAHSYRLIGNDQYQPVPPGGDLKHGTLGNESYTNKADTYGLMLVVDRRDIINDDLGAITTVPRKLGRGSGLKINDVFWTVFLNNATFFVATANNYFAGTNTALSVDGLTNAETAFLNQVDSEGKPIGVMPSIILVPPALSVVGTQLFKSLELRDNTTGSKYPTSNPHQGKYRVEVSRYLSNAYYANSSATAWYLLADPRDLPVVETAFLNGQESPIIETAQADFHVLGVQMRGYHDFGVALQDPRGGIKSKGTA